ncbi:MAG: trimethylamine methyltransferase family protein [Acidobacteriota bacterium]|nr:trimethylamine methyltransferase family protein [Acidobacteriota bacterium]
MRPTLQILDAELTERIVDEALAVLETTGVLVDHPPVLDRLAAVGLPGDPVTRRVTFPPEIVREAIASAPSGFTLYDRDGAPFTRLEGDRVHFVPASSALRILDRATGEIRDATSADYVEYVKVADRLANIAYLSTAFIPKDVPADIADGWRLYLTLAASKKPVVSGAFTSHGVPRMAELMGLLRRDREELAARPMAIFTCCPNTPLRWAEDAAQNLIDCAAAGIPVEIVPVLLLGMISPATPVGALVLHTAEVLSGLAIAQRIRPGTPVLFGGAPASFHMRLMTNPMTAVEALRVYCGYAQVAKHLGLPCQAYMGLSDSKFNDPQAGAESATGMLLAALAGFNSVSGPGMLDYVNCFSLEKLIFDDELAAHAHRFARPLEVAGDLPAAPLLDELIAEGHLLTAEHTLEHWPGELYLPGDMVDRTNWDQWEMAGRRRLETRAREAIAAALEDYDVPPLDPAFHAEARRLFASTCENPEVVLPRPEV